MKFKPIYIYLILLFVALATIITNSSKEDKIIDESNNNMIHNEDHESAIMNSQTPSSANVSSSYVEKMNEFTKRLIEDPNDTLVLREYADFLAVGHKEEEAIINYKKILEVDNKRIDILKKTSLVYFNLGKFRETKEYIVKILSRDAGNTEAIYNLGVVEARIGDLDAAKKQWEDLIANHPNTKMSDMAKESLERLSRK